jgi:2-polyprenyl-6-hydroxyphenyl methylase/3-demethylubiquinone-9 3-methyltransferase
MTAKPKTDREVSIAAEEFVWDTDEYTEIHHFITKPITEQLHAHGASEVLDLGCGNGSFSVLMASYGLNVTGLDHSSSGIQIASKQHLNVRFAQHDITQPLPTSYHGKFDAVVSTEVIEHLLLPRRLMENALSALKPGGLLILTTPYHGYWKNLALAITNKFDSHWHPLRDYGHIKFFSKSTMLGLFREFALQDIQFQTVGRIPALARSMIVSAIKPQ